MLPSSSCRGLVPRPQKVLVALAVPGTGCIHGKACMPSEGPDDAKHRLRRGYVEVDVVVVARMNEAEGGGVQHLTS